MTIAGRSDDAPLKVLLVLGHPQSASLCGALAEAYAEGARGAGASVETLRLGELKFDINYPVGREDDPEEPDLARARDMLSRADHLVLVYPNWWGAMPALLKGFIDRIFKPGYAFRMHSDGTWDGLLKGRSGHLIVTMDTPGWVYRWIYGQPGINALRKATLQFCGIRPVRVTTFGTVFDSNPAQRAAWLARARAEGLRLAQGVPDRAERLRAKAATWLRAMRLQFYPMTWFAYAVGAMAAGGGSQALTQPLFWLGYAVVFMLEFATVLVNEYFDYESDRNNRNFSPFNGGSRVLVDGALSFREVRQGITFAVLAFVLCGALLLHAAGAVGVGLTLGAALILCLGYTAPPLRLSHRGFGELDVAFTHSFLVLLFGYLLFGGHAGDGFPWLASLPLFLAIIPAIVLSALPDHQADLAAGKRTLAVSQGADRVIVLAMSATAASALAALVWHTGTIAAGVYAGISWFAVPHAVWLLHLLRKHRAGGEHSGRINGLMAAALSYILWFAIIPFLNTL